MARSVLRSVSGVHESIHEGESAVLYVSFIDATGEALDKAAISSITLTLFNDADGAVINGRNETDVFDATIGTVTSGGALTLKLTAEDNPVISAEVGTYESHIARLTWTWTDGVGVVLVGKQEFELIIEPIVAAVA